MSTLVTGPDFKRWADSTKIDRKLMCAHLGIGRTMLYGLFKRHRFPNYIALGLQKYRELVEAGRTDLIG